MRSSLLLSGVSKPLQSLLLLLGLIGSSALNVQGQTADLVIQKTGALSIFIGEAMSYTISIQNNGPNAANGASFLDSFPVDVFNVSLASCVASGGATCPTVGDYTIDDEAFAGVIPSLPSGGAVTFVINLNGPAPLNASSFGNTATVTPPAGVTDPDLNTNSSTWNTSVNCNGGIVMLTPIVSPSGSLNCSGLPSQINYTIRWVNTGSSNAAGVRMTHNISLNNRTQSGSGNGFPQLPWAISNLNWQASGSSEIPFRSDPPTWANFGVADFNNMSGTDVPGTGSSGNNIANLRNNYSPNWAPGDTMTLTYTLDLDPVTYTGCGLTYNFNISTNTNFGVNPITCFTAPIQSAVTTSNQVLACAAPACPQADIRTFKQVSNNGPLNCNSFPIALNYTVTFVNQGPDTLRGVRLRDVIRFNNLVNTGTGNAIYTFPWNVSNVNWYASGGSNVPLTIPGLTTVPYSPASGNTSPGLGINGTILTQLPNNETDLFIPGDTIRLTYTLNINQPTISGCGRSISFTLRNEANVINGSGFFNDPVSGNNVGLSDIPVTCDLAPPCLVADIRTTTSIIGGPVGCGDFPVQYQVTARWINQGPDSAHGIVLTHVNGLVNSVLSGGGNATFTFPNAISNQQWSASGQSVVPVTASGANSNPTPVGNPVNLSPTSATTTPRLTGTPGAGPGTGLIANIPLNLALKFYAGDTITLTYTVTVQDANITGCGRSIAFNEIAISNFTIPTSSFVSDPNTSNNSSTALSAASSSATDLAISKSVTPVVVNSGDTITYEVEFQNASQIVSPGSSWVDTLNTNFQYIPGSMTCTVLQGSPPCGVESYDSITNVITIDVGDMPANSAMLYTYRGIAYTDQLLESVNSRAYAINGCFECVPASNFTETNFQILPVELVSFTARVKECKARLQWETASEFNNAGFYVYGSADGFTWTEIGFVSGVGTTNEPQAYQFDVREAVSGVFYYRLLQVDYDGAQEWLPIVAVDPVGCGSSMARVFPNPAKNELEVAMPDAMWADAEIQIMDASGKLMQVYRSTRPSSSKIDISQLPEGMYLVNILSRDLIQTEKVFIIR
jgi:uncharacterized repeat protein (TIGR01451 family)